MPEKEKGRIFRRPGLFDVVGPQAFAYDAYAIMRPCCEHRHLVDIPRTNRLIGSPMFSVASPSAWNSTSSSSVEYLQRSLKTVYFKLSFPA